MSIESLVNCGKSIPWWPWAYGKMLPPAWLPGKLSQGHAGSDDQSQAPCMAKHRQGHIITHFLNRQQGLGCPAKWLRGHLVTNFPYLGNNERRVRFSVIARSRNTEFRVVA